MPAYRISDANHERLRRWAVPLSDSRNDVISRVLDVAEGKAAEEILQQLHYHARSKLQEAIEGFLLAMDTPPPLDSGFVNNLADHILETWFKGASDED